MKKPNKIHHIEARDECGNLVYFEMPRAAIYYGTDQVSIAEEERIQARQERLATEYCALSDKPDSVFSDLAGKEKYVNRKVAKGVWV